MPITAIGNNYTSFAGKKKKSGGVGKALISTVVPGMGQIIDGRYGAGLVYAATSIGLLGASYHINKMFDEDFAQHLIKGKFKTISESLGKAKGIGIIGLGLGALGSISYLLNIKDALTGNKSTK